MVTCDTSSHVDRLLCQQLSWSSTWLGGDGKGWEGGKGGRRGWEGNRKRRDGGGEEGRGSCVALYHGIVEECRLREGTRWGEGLVREEKVDYSSMMA